jgi:signal recognition particle receptor subunit beta
VPAVNYESKELTCKIVYFGPALSGKATNLQWIHDQVPIDRRGDIVQISTQNDRTLFFDYRPLDLGKISGFSTRLHLYTVPGQAYYGSTRKLVLKGADGVVFVADSQSTMLSENVASMGDLHAYLGESGVDARRIPLVLQYNKQDLGVRRVLPAGELDRFLKYREMPSIVSSALHGTGVFETLNAITSAVLRELTPSAVAVQHVA